MPGLLDGAPCYYLDGSVGVCHEGVCQEDFCIGGRCDESEVTKDLCELVIRHCDLTDDVALTPEQCANVGAEVCSGAGGGGGSGGIPFGCNMDECSDEELQEACVATISQCIAEGGTEGDCIAAFRTLLCGR